MKKRKIVLFLLLSVFILTSCGTDKPEVKKIVKTKSYEELPEIDFSITDLEKGEKAMLFYMENKKKFNLCGYMLEVHTSYFGIDHFYRIYSAILLNNKNKFTPNEKKASSFSLALAVIDMNNEGIKVYKNTLISELKKEMNKETNIKTKDMNDKFKEFISLVEEKINLMEEIEEYYSSGEYETDNFAKGKQLNDKYLMNQEKTEQKYKEVYNSFFEIEKIVINNTITHTELGGFPVRHEILKSRELLKMFSKEFYVTKLDFDETITDKDKSIIVIKEEDKEDYINNLKSIQKTLDKSISNMEKIEKGIIKKEAVDNEKYEQLLSKIKEISVLTKEIIAKLEKNDYTDLETSIRKYILMNSGTEEDFINLLKI